MSMPLPIHVVLIGSTVSKVSAAQKFFRLSQPGIGAPYLAALDATTGGKIVPPSDLPEGLITLWLCLDCASLDVSKGLHSRDLRSTRYDRGFYDDLLPEACVLLQCESPATFRELLKTWEQKIVRAWFETS